jgi:hypothetical protein
MMKLQVISFTDGLKDSKNAAIALITQTLEKLVPRSDPTVHQVEYMLVDMSTLLIGHDCVRGRVPEIIGKFFKISF